MLSALEPRQRVVEIAERQQGNFIWANPDPILPEARVEPFMIPAVQKRERETGRALLTRHPPLNTVMWRARPRPQDLVDRHTVPSPFFAWLLKSRSVKDRVQATQRWNDRDGAINCFGFVLHCLYGAGLLSLITLKLTRDKLQGEWWNLFAFEKAQRLCVDASVEPGDLLFFSYQKTPQWVSHVAVYGGRDPAGTEHVIDINATKYGGSGRVQKRPLVDVYNDFGCEPAEVEVAWVNLFTCLENCAQQARNKSCRPR